MWSNILEGEFSRFCVMHERKKKIFPLLFRSCFWFVSFDSLLPHFPVFFSSFFSLPCMSVCLATWTNYQDLLTFTAWSATSMSIYWHQSLHIWAISNIIPEPIKRPTWIRELKRMHTLFLSCKSSVSGSIPGLSLTNDTWCDPYSFPSWVNMMAATLW